MRVPMCPQICTLKEPADVAATDQAMEHVMLALQVTHVSLSSNLAYAAQPHIYSLVAQPQRRYGVVTLHSGGTVA